MKLKAALINPWTGIQVGTVHFTYDELEGRFFKALEILTCFDCTVLSRSLGVASGSVRRWRDTLILPKDPYLMFETIKWVEGGKPVEKIDDEEFIPWLN